jgi:phosphatidylethanolamine/phosphatidyl-N-methylethanolamine N-methyltransferase
VRDAFVGSRTERGGAVKQHRVKSSWRLFTAAGRFHAEFILSSRRFHPPRVEGMREMKSPRPINENTPPFPSVVCRLVDEDGRRAEEKRAATDASLRPVLTDLAGKAGLGGPCSTDRRMPHPLPIPRFNNHRVSAFYDWAYWLYPLVDGFCAPGRNRLLRSINQAPPGDLLEIGVGPGRHLRLYRNHKVTAIDCSATMVSSSRGFSPTTDVRQMDGEDLEFPDASYDYVVLCHVLSVTADPARMLAEAYRVLRPGGRVFVLNHETPSNGWRHVDHLLIPLARRLHFRSWFRLEEIPGVDRFRKRPLGRRGVFGLMSTYSLEK